MLVLAAILGAVVAYSSAYSDALALRSFVMMAGSMEPTLFRDEAILARTRFAYPLKRGTVVVFDVRAQPFISRIVGVEGDRVEMIDGVLQINGAAVRRQRIDLPTSFGAGGIPRYYETLPGGRSFETLDLYPSGLADNTPIFEVPAGHYFMVSDNRDNAADSRLPRQIYGYIPESDIIAVATIIMNSPNPDRIGTPLN